MPTADLVRGLLVFGEDAKPFRDATVEIVLEDTTMADAPARTVTRIVLDRVSYDGRQPGIAFELTRSPAPPQIRQTLRVLIDVDGDGRLGAGDYRHASSIVVPAGAVRDLKVPVRRM